MISYKSVKEESKRKVFSDSKQGGEKMAEKTGGEYNGTSKGDYEDAFRNPFLEPLIQTPLDELKRWL